MTTTAEKINQCCIKLDDLRGKIEELEEEMQRLRSDNSKPADPEPLECWVHFVDGKPQSVCSDGNNCCTHMRQVTPQDEQDRKDAARYRLYKELAIFDVSWRRVHTIRNLDKHLDQEMIVLKKDLQP